ncbi:VWA domain-containing protein [Streptomyces sp. NPDC047002]|uniref:vWA domain-containing protein n=1 Tax=Streptomyces sp. NPDC047002 TaxID=3155475 RepID=UPI00345382E7
MIGQAPSLLPAVDRAAFAMALAGRLRARGVRVGLTAAGDLVRALGAVPELTRTTLYWTARVCLIRDHDGLAEFDDVFEAVFGDAMLSLDPHARRDGLGAAGGGQDDTYASVPGGEREEQEGAGLPWLTLPPSVTAADAADDQAVAVPERLPTAVAGLLDTPFEQLGPAEAALLGRWLEAALRTWPTRRSRRFSARRGGPRVLLRPTVARARRTGWEPVRLVRAGPVAKPRRVVMVCDVSRSMQPQAVAYLHLMRALTLAADAEVFAFATSLTRLTTVLAHRSAEAAVAEASAKVEDRFGGTRIATCLRSLLASHHGGLLRGAVVIIASDGWDGDAPELLAGAMARVRRRAHQVVWLNPRVSAPGFVPRTTTMAAALPYCDALLPADTFASLRTVFDEVCGRACAPARGDRRAA